MLAKRLATILPPLTLDEALETTKIHSIVGLLKPGQALVTQRPFRAPHHTASDAGLLGGNINPTPGEISLAHHGVCFWTNCRSSSAAFWKPCASRSKKAASRFRARGHDDFSVAIHARRAMNPTPDGKMPGESKSSPREIQSYLGRISGPLLDRIDLHVEVPQVKFREISGDRTGETSAEIRARVITARQIQHKRFAHKPKITCNARLGPKELKEFCALDDSTKNCSKRDGRIKFQRACLRPHLKVARTIAIWRIRKTF